MAPRRKRTTEGSCWHCKHRRVMCDLKQPSCSRCAAANQPCEYGQRFRWCGGVASRGHFAGQNIPDTTSSYPVPTAPQYIITTDQQMLYFEHEVLARFNLATKRLEVDLLSISKDSAQVQSVTAIANAHFLHYTKTSSKVSALEQTRARAVAVQMFREQLMTEKEFDTPVTDIFTTNVLLCVLDGIIEPHDEAAATQCHFYGGRAILEQWNCLNQLFLMKKGLIALMFSVFATMDLTYALLSGQRPFFEPSSWLRFGDSDAWWGHLAADDPFLEILSVLSQFAFLGHRVHQYRETISIGELLSLQMALEQIDQRSQVMLKQSDISSATALLDASSSEFQESWYMFCSAYRLAALIYMYRVLCGLESTHPLVQEATNERIKAICSTQFTKKLSSCLLFPTLIVGCHALDAASRKAIRRSLDSTASYLSFGSTRIMTSFLDQIWMRSESQGDWQWFKSFQTLSKTTFLF